MATCGAEPNIELNHADEFKGAFATIAKAKSDAMIVLADRFLLAHRSGDCQFCGSKPSAWISKPMSARALTAIRAGEYTTDVAPNKTSKVKRLFASKRKIDFVL